MAIVVIAVNQAHKALVALAGIVANKEKVASVAIVAKMVSQA